MTGRMVGIDIEQFLRDPYATGIQRVLQYLAIQWPVDIPAAFVVPLPQIDDAFALVKPNDAVDFLTLPFHHTGDRAHLKTAVEQWVVNNTCTVYSTRELHDVFDSWLLPEVSYLPSVVSRFEDFRAHARTSMIGYDILPMIEPANYRFPPGRAAWVSEYFRMLAVADSVACISEYSMRGVVDRLRRPVAATTFVASPGGDHLPSRHGLPPDRPTFIRVGTMEARKMPVEILEAFTKAVDEGLEADLVYVGTASASDHAINERISSAIGAGYPVRWIQGASDTQVHDLVQRSTAFLSMGIEGYGIPVLEAIRLGTPVIYSGEQPAARLMDGRGCRVVDISEGIGSVFTWDFGQLRSEIEPDSVPTWEQFAREVARAATTP